MARHSTQRGDDRRLPTFFCEHDYTVYLELLSEWCGRFHLDIWLWCLMPNHIHLVAVPETEEGLCRAIGEIHRRYTRYVNFREGVARSPLAGTLCFLWDGYALYPCGGALY